MTAAQKLTCKLTRHLSSIPLTQRGNGKCVFLPPPMIKSIKSWEQFVTYAPPSPPLQPPLPATLLLKIMNTEPHSHSCAQPSEEAPPLASWANGARSSLIILVPGWPMAHLSLTHMTSFCALPVLSALNPGECRHHWRPDAGGIGRPPSSAQLTRCYLEQTLLPSDEADPSRRRQWPRFDGATDFFRLQNGEAHRRRQ